MIISVIIRRRPDPDSVSYVVETGVRAYLLCHNMYMRYLPSTAAVHTIIIIRCPVYRQALMYT